MLSSTVHYRGPRPSYTAALAFIGLFMLGCDGSGPRMAAVSGTVTYKAQPVANANVSFVPADTSSRLATGVTDSNGRFTLGTLTADDGAIVGLYKIGVIAHGPARPAKPGEGSGMPGETIPGEPTIPKKYFSPETSGLQHEVKPGSNTFELALSD